MPAPMKPSVQIFDAAGVRVRLEREGVCFLSPDGEAVPLIPEGSEDVETVALVLEAAAEHLRGLRRS